MIHFPLADSLLAAQCERRATPGLLEQLAADARVGVVEMDQDGALAVDGDALAVLPVPGVLDERIWVFLGNAAGRDYLLAIGQAREGREYVGGRSLLSRVDGPTRGIAVTAAAIGNWHHTAPHCPRCGGATEVRQAGWTRWCPTCRTEHYPRTDPAVIMAITDAHDRVLLAHARHFPQRRFSVLAGYVEPGESLEAAVVRETAEEVGLRVTDVTYRGSQAWPFPRSLMLAFTARVSGTPTPRVDGQELTQARFFSRAELAAALGDGSVLLPPPASAAAALLERWYGAPLPRGGTPSTGAPHRVGGAGHDGA